MMFADRDTWRWRVHIFKGERIDNGSEDVVACIFLERRMADACRYWKSSAAMHDAAAAAICMHGDNELNCQSFSARISVVLEQLYMCTASHINRCVHGSTANNRENLLVLHNAM